MHVHHLQGQHHETVKTNIKEGGRRQGVKTLGALTLLLLYTKGSFFERTAPTKKIQTENKKATSQVFT